MIKRIDLFMFPDVSRYGVLNFFTARLAEALQRLGVRCRVLQAEDNNPKHLLSQILVDPELAVLSGMPERSSCSNTTPGMCARPRFWKS